MCDLNDIDPVHFAENCRRIQEEYGNLLGDRLWDEIEKLNVTILHQKVAFGLFGPPHIVPTDDNLNLGYENDQIEQIKKISSMLVEDIYFNSENIHFRCIFIIGKVSKDQQITFPVFIVKGENTEKCILVDSFARKYCDWDDFLLNKKLPRGRYCYPSKGVYERINGLLSLKFCNPIESQEIRNINVRRNKVDSFKETFVGESLLQVNPVPEILAEVCGNEIIETISKTENIIEKAKEIAYFYVKSCSLTFNDLKIIYYIAVLANKLEKNEISPIDLHQLNALILFFKNVSVTFERSIASIQRIVTTVENQRSESEKELIKKHTYKLRGSNETVNLKSLTRIENDEDLFNFITDDKSQDFDVTLTEKDGLLILNENLKIHPLKLFDITVEDQNKILDALKNFTLTTHKDFDKKMAKILSINRFQFEHTRLETINLLCKHSSSDTFPSTSSHDLDRIRVTFINTMNRDFRILNLTKLFADSRQCKNLADFVAFGEFISSFIDDYVEKIEEKYDNDRKKAEILDDFEINKFNKDYGVVGRPSKFFKDTAINQLNTTEGVKLIEKYFIKLLQEVSSLNMECKLKFFNSFLAISHYFKHKDLGWGDLNPKESFETIKDILSNPCSNKSTVKLSQEGDCFLIHIIDKERQIRIIIGRKRNGENGLVSVMMDDTIEKDFPCLDDK